MLDKTCVITVVCQHWIQYHDDNGSLLVICIFTDLVLFMPCCNLTVQTNQSWHNVNAVTELHVPGSVFIRLDRQVFSLDLIDGLNYHVRSQESYVTSHPLKTHHSLYYGGILRLHNLQLILPLEVNKLLEILSELPLSIAFVFGARSQVFL